MYILGSLAIKNTKTNILFKRKNTYGRSKLYYLQKDFIKTDWNTKNKIPS